MNETTITILEVSDKGTQVKVKGQGQDGIHTYTVWKNKQDGSETQAYSLLKTKQVNQQITFVWEEYHGEYQGKAYVSRTVKMAKEGGNVNYQAPTPAQPTYTPKNNDDIRANVALKMVSELVASGKAELKDWEAWANKFYHYKPSFAPRPTGTMIAPPLTGTTGTMIAPPQVDNQGFSEEEIKVDNIPF